MKVELKRLSKKGRIMKNITSFMLNVSIILILSITFTSCGESEDEGGNKSKEQSEYTSVTLERGKVYGATITDSLGAVAIRSHGSNVYIFNTPPSYPIKAIGGWIDVDNDLKMTSKDIILNIEMVSYTDIITPITTYISDDSTQIREEKLKSLSELTNIPAEILQKLPSESNTETILLTNAIFKTMLENDSTSLIDNFDDIDSSYNALKNYLDSVNHKEPLYDIAILIEEKVASDLVLNSYATVPTNQEINAYLELQDSLECDSVKCDYTNGDGVDNGVSCLVNEDGIIENKLSYKDGENTGIMCFYNKNNGVLLQRWFNINGIQYGINTGYHENGNIHAEDTMVNHVMDGISILYDIDGNKIIQSAYKNNQLHGLDITYYTNGNVKTESPHVEGVIHGTRKEYCPSGKLHMIHQVDQDDWGDAVYWDSCDEVEINY